MSNQGNEVATENQVEQHSGDSRQNQTEFRGIIEGERWAVIHDGFYAVSDHGRVMRTASGKASNPGQIKDIRISSTGYHIAALYSNCKMKHVRIHIQVAAEFIGPCPEGHEVNHKDGNPLNNHYSNLEYTTHTGNMHHMFHTGLRKCKFSEADIEDIRRRVENGEKQIDLAVEYGTSKSYLNSIVKRNTRKVVWENQ